MGARHLVAACVALACCLDGRAQDECASTLAALRRMEILLHDAWQETSMTDGKPLVLQLADHDDALHLAFDKTGEGLWARGRAVVCRRGPVLEARLVSVQLGPAAPWLLRQSLAAAPVFVLRRGSALRLEVSTPGWSGQFRPLR